MRRPARTLLFLTAAILSLTGGRATAADRPDVVVFLIDDMDWRSASIYGGKDVPTPNMDRVAADGMTFSYAFVASPSCAPSRAALLTGLDPMRNGSMINHARPKADIKRWPAYFKELGYETAAIGKTAHYAQVTEYGFDHVSHFKYHEDTCIQAAVDWLAARKSDKPLCLLVGTNWSHVPWPKESNVSPDAVEVPANQIETPETRAALSRYDAAVSNADRDLGMVYDAMKKHLKPDTLFLFSADHGAQLPFGKWNCYDAGMRTPLVVAWPGKIKPGSRSDAIVSWIDFLPTCVEAAGGTPPGSLSGRSFLGVLEGKADRLRDEVYLTHSADGIMNNYPIRGVRTRDWKYLRNLDPDAEHHTHIDKGVAIDGKTFWDSWKRAAENDPKAAATVARYHHRPAEELYDLRSDPSELHNLAADPAQADRLAELRGKVDAWMKDQGDKGLETEKTIAPPRARAAAAAR
ncbi:sulfatase family protein [Paludisphaera rhizosphaerae]|uniref:sulfatase family protein n=1 Tax=Paludisphaera rhizosphaerae TaxID=2711216 RepID=UPI0013EA7829|nr:sulfatase [Paludisphaera rhizosphaerae]